ncbi:MAG: twin-arginine translocase TatA/TatE family subunit [Deltaproteobacteria bacterium]|nr:twin-arginine translocase TatA/TatE family subunit [Deltaproteobacteria bacterium]
MTHFFPALLLGLGGLGVWELVVILLIILIVFGVGKLPQIGSGLGQGIRNFKKGIQGDESEEKEEAKKTPPIDTPK